jgi:enterochelin esterase-like enzyme
MTKREEPFSPRLKLLSQEIETGNKTALDSFWQEVSAQGTPLIEADGENPDFSLVTFLWLGTDETKYVIVQIPVAGTGEDEHNLLRLLDSNLWYATFRLRNDYRAAYKFVESASPDPEQTIETPDPLNPKTFIEPKDEERPDHTEDDIDSVVELSAAPSQPWAAFRPESAKGKVEHYLFQSHILGNERRIWVYTPPQYTTADNPYGLLIVLDGRFFTFAINTPTILDNLLADDQIPPFMAVMVDNPGHTWEQSIESREKEMSCYTPFADFLAQEMVPWIRQNYHISADAAETVVVGGSYGGLSAVFTALQHPEIFGNVIALSGSFWWKPKNEEEWEWLTRQYALSPLHPLRFYLEVGLLESKPTQTEFPGQVLSNRHLRSVLQAKGYEVHYDEQMHGHDSMPWQGTFAEGLMALFK